MNLEIGSRSCDPMIRRADAAAGTERGFVRRSLRASRPKKSAQLKSKKIGAASVDGETSTAPVSLTAVEDPSFMESDVRQLFTGANVRPGSGLCKVLAGLDQNGIRTLYGSTADPPAHHAV